MTGIKTPLTHYIDIIYVLTQKEMKVRYKSSYLGYLWSVLHPLAFALVFFMVFKVVMRIGMEDYAIFLIAGLFPWQWFSNSINFSPMIFINNAAIVKKVKFPRDTLPLSVVLQDMIHFILSILVIVFFLLIYGRAPSLSWLYGVPALLAIQFLMTYGISLVVASVNVFFRDLERLTTIFMTFLFYCTPIIYPETMVPERYQYLLSLNPLAPLMISWRGLFLDGTVEPGYLMLSLAYAVVSFVLGRMIFKRLSWKFAEAI
ncbi:MAG: ABC transporter permease [Thermodesulfobacteriota bacterium]